MRRLEKWYGSLFGREAERGHLYLGFYTFLSGVALGIAALGLFLYAEGLHPAALLAWREAAIVLASLSAPLILLGTGFALPARWSVRIIATAGAVFCFGVSVLFTMHYPQHFNARGQAGITDYAPLIAGLYTIGMVVLCVGLMTQLIAYYIRKQNAGDESGGWEESEYEVPDWMVEQDIEQAMKLYPTSWGSRVDFDALSISIHDDFGPDAIILGDGIAHTDDLDVPALNGHARQINGDHWDERQVFDESDDQASQLRRLRQLQKEKPHQYLPHKRSWWRRWFWPRDRHRRPRGSGHD